MQTRNTPNKAGSESEIIRVLRKVVPFFFRGKRKSKSVKVTPERAVVRQPLSVARTKSSKKSVTKKKVVQKAKRPARLPAATLEARKTAKTGIPLPKKTPASDAAVLSNNESQDIPAITTDVVAPSSEKQPKGKFVLKDDEPSVDAKAVKAGLLEEAQDDSFLSKVALKDAPKADTKKVSGWSLLSGRFFGKRDTAPVLPTEAKAAGKKIKGRFLLEDDQSSVDPKAVKAELLEEAKDDSFLSKVALKNAGNEETQKTSGWSLLTGRFFGRGEKPARATKNDAIPVMTEKDVKQDSFLQRVEKKKSTAVVGTAVDEDAEGGLEEFSSAPRDKTTSAKAEESKGRILSAADLRKETKEAKEAALRLEKEVKEIKEEMKSRGAAARGAKDEKEEAEEKPKKEEKPVLHLKKNDVKKNGFQQFLAGIGYIGLGKERLMFIQNLATMLNAGLPLVDAIKTLQAETKPKPMKKLLQRVVDMVDNGSPLWRALDAQSFFSPHAIALVRIGEEAGNLAGNMTYLAAQDEKDHELKSKVKMAMIYPSIVLTIMAVIIVVLGMFVLPNLIGVLMSLNVPLPLTTRIVIMVSNAFTEYGTIGVPASLGGVVVLLVLNKYTALRVVFQWITFKVPGVGKLAREATIARFGVILGGLLKAGVPVTEAMHSLTEVTTIVSYRRFYIRMLDHITVGDSFAKSFSTIKGSEKLLPPSVQQLVITGEKSGALADIMLKIADIYDKKASETAQKLPVILEPMLLLFIGSLVGTIAFAILVPIYSIVGNVGR